MDEVKIVEIQLDRKINNYLKTAKYCPFEFPAVIIVNPFFNEIVAPTIYWLSCPYLIYKIDRLESESDLISEFGQKLKNDSKFRALMEKTHKNYAINRKKFLTKKQLIKAKNISEDLYKTLLYSGVGGIKAKKGIKCLHTHLADYLAGNSNPVGKIVFSKIDWPEKCTICKERIDEFEGSSS